MAMVKGFEIDFREKGSSEWGVRYFASDVSKIWGRLGAYGFPGFEGGFPDRVRVSEIHDGGFTRVVFDGSYPAALLWSLGVWGKLTSGKRTKLEETLKEAFCITSGECQEDEDDGKKDNVEGTGGGR